MLSQGAIRGEEGKPALIFFTPQGLENCALPELSGLLFMWVEAEQRLHSSIHCVSDVPSTSPFSDLIAELISPLNELHRHLRAGFAMADSNYWFPPFVDNTLGFQTYSFNQSGVSHNGHINYAKDDIGRLLSTNEGTELQLAIFRSCQVKLSRLYPYSNPLWPEPGLDNTALRRTYLICAWRIWSSDSELSESQWQDAIACHLNTEQQVNQPASVNLLTTRRTIVTAVRREVWRRDQGRCVECGSNEKLEYDHIIPYSRGGSDTVRNLRLLCELCNRRKGATI
jgi:hypothetical protein